jgi:uncharacterized protein YbjT (DUF2867 family)
VLLCGATGLVGAECLKLLCGDPFFERVVVLTRRPLPPELRPSVGLTALEEHVVDFTDLASHSTLFRVDQVVCALGTTRKRAGSKARFREVDLGFPLAIAELAVERGADHFLLVSAVGADARSRIFYNRVKGELEQALIALPYRRITIARPSLLLGDRRERRIGEEIAKRLSFLAPPRYRPVPAAAVAAALVRAARQGRPGRRIIESEELRSTLSDEAALGGGGGG